jgi:hypothetical protein
MHGTASSRRRAACAPGWSRGRPTRPPRRRPTLRRRLRGRSRRLNSRSRRRCGRRIVSIGPRCLCGSSRSTCSVVRAVRAGCGSSPASRSPMWRGVSSTTSGGASRTLEIDDLTPTRQVFSGSHRPLGRAALLVPVPKGVLFLLSASFLSATKGKQIGPDPESRLGRIATRSGSRRLGHKLPNGSVLVQDALDRPPVLSIFRPGGLLISHPEARRRATGRRRPPAPLRRPRRWPREPGRRPGSRGAGRCRSRRRSRGIAR